MNLVTNCVNCPKADLPELKRAIEEGREIKFRTALKHVGRANLAECFDHYNWDRKGGLRMADDFHIGYLLTTWHGKKAVMVVHSAIEYVFV